MTVATHVKTHKVPYIVALIIPLAPIAAALIGQGQALQTHYLTQEHPATESKIENLTIQVNLGLELQLAKEIHNILQKRCEANDTSFDPQLERLQKAYKAITKSRYTLRCGASS